MSSVFTRNYKARFIGSGIVLEMFRKINKMGITILNILTVRIVQLALLLLNKIRPVYQMLTVTF